MSSTKIPALLEPHLRKPLDTELVLLTGVLGASTNWLVLRWMYALLRPPTPEEDDDAAAAVVMCSFLRDGGFWRDGALKLGLDLDALRRSQRFVFVDGLTGLYAPRSGESADDVVLGSDDVDDVQTTLLDAVASLGGRQRRVVLILDQMDAWLAMSATSCLEALNMLTRLREKVHATVLTVAADDALLHAHKTTLEREHGAFAVSVAHEAQRVMGLRLLDTGAASDVSGVLRLTDAEYLYHVAGDGGVRVFERGGGV